MENERLFQEQVAFKFRDIEIKIDGLSEKVDSLEVKIDNLETRFETLETRFDALEARFETLETRFETLEAKIDTLTELITKGFSNLKEEQVYVKSRIFDLERKIESVVVSTVARLYNRT